MENMRKFKDPLYLRLVSTFMAIVSFASLFGNAETSLYLSFFIFLSLAVYTNGIKYILSDGELIIKKPLSKVTVYKLQDVRRIEEQKGLLPYLKIYFTTKKKPLIFQSENQKALIAAILNYLKDKKKLEFNENDKWVNFLPL
jgi:hypothetical protein